MAVGVKENATSAAVWMRGLYIIVFGVILYFVFGLVWLLVIFQFFTKLLTGELNQPLRRFAAPLSRYVSQVLSYITFQSDERPFPFSPWPADESADEPPAKPPAQPPAKPSAQPPAKPPAKSSAQGTRPVAKKKTPAGKRAAPPPSRKGQTGGPPAQPEE